MAARSVDCECAAVARVERLEREVESVQAQTRRLFATAGDLTEGQHARDLVLERLLHRLERLERSDELEPAAPRRRRRPPLPVRLQRELELA